MLKFTINVNGINKCQNESYIPKFGKGCCYPNKDDKKYCYCKKEKEVYNFYVDKCKNRFVLKIEKFCSIISFKYLNYNSFKDIIFVF